MHWTLENIFFRTIIGISGFVLLLTAGVYAYLGTFSRYAGDDYCEAARVTESSPVGAVVERYFFEDWPRATMRYSNLLFVGLSESLGRYNMPVTMASMVLLWFTGIVWGFHEIRKFLGIAWEFLNDLFWGLILGFFSLRQAPNLFETVYWRSAMMTHFAPLVFGLFLFAFLVRQARRPQSPSMWIYLFIFAAALILGGFSEPPTTTILTAIPLVMLAVWLWVPFPARRKYLSLLFPVLAGAFLGLLAMLLAPASADAAQGKSLNVVQLLTTSFLYSYLFIADSLKTQPLPMFLSMLIALLFAWLHGQMRPSELSYEHRKLVVIALLATPILAWLLIAAGFSPSVYGQSFPVERMRFLARAILIAVFMLEGALLGMLLANIKIVTNTVPAQALAAFLFAVIAIGYPLRTAARLLQEEVPDYRSRAQQWDARDASMRAMKEDGVRDLVVPFLADEIIQDLGDHKGFRLNRCASVLYGVDSILALPMQAE